MCDEFTSVHCADRGMYREALWRLWLGVSWGPKWSCVALVLNVVCKSATWGSWGFVSQWVSVSEWERSHGWLMNDRVFVAINVRQSPSQGHSQSPAGVRRLRRHPGCRSGEFGWHFSAPFLSGDNSVQWAAHREMLCLAEWKPSGLRSALFGVCEDLLELLTEAAVSRRARGDGAGDSPVNFNTSMQNGGRHVRRKEMLQDTAAFVCHKNSRCSICTCKVKWRAPATFLWF